MSEVGAEPDLGSVRAPFAFRRHQGEALDALAKARAAGRTRAWVVLPPGAGKTLVGLETIRREGVRAVVLSPNTAIQGQWVRGWQSMLRAGPDDAVAAARGVGVGVGVGRDLTAPVTALTYQALAVFESEPDEDGGPKGDEPDDARTDDSPTPELDRLHPHGRALVEAMRAAGPLTLVLDECHHLLESWGRLLAELLDLLPDATVLGLTATPAASLTADQADLVETLFGEVVYATSIPAVVREGHLAPFTDLVWLTTPTSEEAQWLDSEQERFAELTTALSDPAYGSTPFLTWVDQRFAGGVSFRHVARAEPELADAALRLRHAGLLALPDDVESGEQHRRDPSADDWALLIGDWYAGCLRESDDARDRVVCDGLRAALPSVGWTLGRAGLRRGRSPVDRVLSRSGAKSRALVEIVAAEHRGLGERLAMLVVCDHERSSATVPADLAGVVTDRAGSARLALADLLADPDTAGLAPIMVTGRTVAADPQVLGRLRDRLTAEGTVRGLVVGETDADGIAELSGPGGSWHSRSWVRAVTEELTSGRCQVLVGTRALLGEGWDAPRVTGLVDLSTTTTPGSIVQTRGRTLRLDPTDPDKVAVNWTVCAVADSHPRGDNDWQRTVRKHRDYFGVDATGDVVDGVAHIHSSFSPFAPPDVATFDAINIEMMLRAQRRDLVRAAWAVGTPYDDQVRVAAWLRPRADRTPVGPGSTAADLGGDEVLRAVPRPALLTADGVRLDDPGAWPARPTRRDRSGALAAAVPLSAVALWIEPVLLVVVAMVIIAWLVVLGARHRRAVEEAGEARRELLVAATAPPDLVEVAGAVADGLQAAGLTSAGSAALAWHPDPDGQVRFVLETTGPQAQAHSELFATALAEAVAPVAAPRYLVPVPVAAAPTTGAEAMALTGPGDVRPTGQVWHPVPSALGARAELARAYARSWGRWTGGGAALHTGNAEGAGVLAAVRGTHPADVETSVLRLSWH